MRRTIMLATLAVLDAGLFACRPAVALPLYARQTGQQCAACHNGFPELTPYGRLFKLNAYTFGGGRTSIPPISAMAVVSFTHTDADQSGPPAPHYNSNDNPAFDFISVFYGGVLLPHLGLFGQATYNNFSKTFGWDNTDLRYAQVFRLFDRETILGVSVNNNPTVSDIWNTTPAWGYPWLASGLASTPTAKTLVEGSLAQQVVGVMPYLFWDRLIYVEAGGYRTLGNRALQTLGVDQNGVSSINGVAPYWRVAIEPTWGPNSWEFGTFGLAAAQAPGGLTGFGTDHTVDLGFDTQYQYLGDRHSFSVQASWIHENAQSSASLALGNTANGHDHLDSTHIKTSYYYNQTYGGTIAHFAIDGTKDALLYGSNSANGSPKSAGWIAELDYLPFNHGGPAFWPWLNLKIGLQYTLYTEFNGASRNYDGFGTNAGDNNTLYLFAWLAF